MKEVQTLQTKVQYNTTNKIKSALVGLICILQVGLSAQCNLAYVHPPRRVKPQ